MNLKRKWWQVSVGAAMRTVEILGIISLQLSATQFCNAQVVIAWSAGPLDAKPAHNSPEYIAKNVSWIEARPFDGMVINEFLGRNLLNLGLSQVAPAVTSAVNGSITYEAATKGLAPVNGIFKVFTENFVKVNMFMTSLPPMLNDDAGWAVVTESARNYSKAVGEAGLKGIMLDNESYTRPKNSSGRALDYWLYSDQLSLAKISSDAVPVGAMTNLARKRGGQLVAALQERNPELAVIIAHGPYVGCASARDAISSIGQDDYLMGAFAAGMIEAATRPSQVTDGGELYDYRQDDEFRTSREWRKGIEAERSDSITTIEPRKNCPFMDSTLASNWPKKANIAFGTFDKKRSSARSNVWMIDTDAKSFQQTLTNALANTDRYVWHYTQWQDWWGRGMEDALAPFARAIVQAKSDARNRTRELIQK